MMTPARAVGGRILLVGGPGVRAPAAGVLDLPDKGVSHCATKVDPVERADRGMRPKRLRG